MVFEARTISLTDDYDVVLARQCAREIARDMGFGLTDQTRIATAVSEIARRALESRGKSHVHLSTLLVGTRRGIQCTCLGGMELKVPAASGSRIPGGIERLMDDIEWTPQNEGQMSVVMRKWLDS